MFSTAGVENAPFLQSSSQNLSSLQTLNNRGPQAARKAHQMSPQASSLASCSVFPRDKVQAVQNNLSKIFVGPRLLASNHAQCLAHQGHTSMFYSLQQGPWSPVLKTQDLTGSPRRKYYGAKKRLCSFLVLLLNLFPSTLHKPFFSPQKKQSHPASRSPGSYHLILPTCLTRRSEYV